jgi:hypothetical protein
MVPAHTQGRMKNSSLCYVKVSDRSRAPDGKSTVGGSEIRQGVAHRITTDGMTTSGFPGESRFSSKLASHDLRADDARRGREVVADRIGSVISRKCP